MSKAADTFKKLMAWTLAHSKGFVALIDIDKDGDVDGDDIVMLIDKSMEVGARLASSFAGWATMTVGQKMDAIIDECKIDFPKVPSKAWVVLEGIGYLVDFFLKASAKKDATPAK